MFPNKKSIWQKIGFGVGVLLLILLALGQIYKKDLLRLRFVITLFHPPTIVENLRSMTRFFDYGKVRRGGRPYRIPYESKRLPGTYPYKGG